MGDEQRHELRTVLVAAGRETVPEALATARSAAESGAGADVVVLATESVGAAFSEFEVLPVHEVLPAGVADEILEDGDLLAFAEPFAMELVVGRYGATASVEPGAIVVGDFAALEMALAERPFLLTAPIVVPPSDTTVPRLTLRDPQAPISSVVVAARRGSSTILRSWQQTMVDSLFDPNLAPPHMFRGGFLLSQLGTPSVGVEGSATVVRWVEWAGMASSDAGVRGTASVVDAAELWHLDRDTAQRVGGEMTETEYRLVDLRLHDAGPLEPIRERMTKALADAGSPEPTTPYEEFARAIRRCSDPTGTRWPTGSADAFHVWLFERNRLGMTRIGDLYWYADPAMQKRFPRARVDATDYSSWCHDQGRRLLGFDLLDETVIPAVPSPAIDDTPSGWKNALVWRWNVLKGLVPGVAEAGERREHGLDVVTGPGGGRRAAPPERLLVDRRPALWGTSPRQLSLVGCVRAESGLGQASRASLRALRSLGLEFSYIDTSEKYPSRNSADVGLDRSTFGATGDVNLIHANAMEIVKMNDSVLRHRLGGRFNAAMWFWEAGNLPAWKLAAFDRVDELWVASNYLADVFGQYGRVPVHTVGLAAPLPAARTVDRATMGIDEDEFVFLFVYDALSSHGRKNPELVVSAFMDAFGPDFAGVRLIIKASNLNKLPIDRRRLMALATTTPAITVIDRYLDHEDVYDLMAAADVYVSLHAAEGYGLTILESMSLGTPPICTAYSGNMDFTTEENAWLVNYDLIRTDEIAGPYPKGSIWALPDREHATMLMRHVSAHRDEVAAKASAARVAAVEAASLDRYARALSANLDRVM